MKIQRKKTLKRISRRKSISRRRQSKPISRRKRYSRKMKGGNPFCKKYKTTIKQLEQTIETLKEKLKPLENTVETTTNNDPIYGEANAAEYAELTLNKPPATPSHSHTTYINRTNAPARKGRYGSPSQPEVPPPTYFTPTKLNLEDVSTA